MSTDAANDALFCAVGASVLYEAHTRDGAPFPREKLDELVSDVAPAS